MEGVLKACRKCGLFFMPRSSSEDKCGICAQKRQSFERKPIDLFERWADVDY